MKRGLGVFLFCLGILLFSWPLLSIFQNSLAYYLFIVWFVFIGLMFLASTSKQEDGGN